MVQDTGREEKACVLAPRKLGCRIPQKGSDLVEASSRYSYFGGVQVDGRKEYRRGKEE